MTLPAVPVAARGALTLGRVVAALSGGSMAVHLALVTWDSLASLAMVAMAGVCLPCAWHLWRAPTPSVWRFTAGVDLGMLLVHLPVTGAVHGAHHAAHGPQALMQVGVALVVCQLVLATAVLLRGVAGRLRRRPAVRAIPSARLPGLAQKRMEIRKGA